LRKLILIEKKKLKHLLEKHTLLPDDESLKLGLKIEADEVEKFISSNCQEINKDKWLCPLSGKKFKAPDFIRKHIFNKFSEKVEEVKLETQYYNNYIKDSQRPELPERPTLPVKNTPRKSEPRVEEPEDDYSDEVPPTTISGSRKRSVHQRLGRQGIKMTQTGTDPREIVDYSDITDMQGPHEQDAIF